MSADALCWQATATLAAAAKYFSCLLLNEMKSVIVIKKYQAMFVDDVLVKEAK